MAVAGVVTATIPTMAGITTPLLPAIHPRHGEDERIQELSTATESVIMH